MKNTALINSEIIFLLALITEKYPELTVFLDELTITIPDEQHPAMNDQILKAYHNTLSSLIAQYKSYDDSKADQYLIQ
ncbi:MAG: hypothetical protein RL007_877 [Bacteroidota bacterium]|jgi:hypothetical protein